MVYIVNNHHYQLCSVIDDNLLSPEDPEILQELGVYQIQATSGLTTKLDISFFSNIWDDNLPSGLGSDSLSG